MNQNLQTAFQQHPRKVYEKYDILRRYLGVEPDLIAAVCSYSPDGGQPAVLIFSQEQRTKVTPGSLWSREPDNDRLLSIYILNLKSIRNLSSRFFKYLVKFPINVIMTKQIFFLVFAAFLFLSATDSIAQFSVGAELGLPAGNFSNSSNPGIGASVRYDASLGDKLNWTASAGFLVFGGRTYLGGAYGNFSIIPLVGGVKYYFVKANEGVYAAADLGLNIINYSVAYPNQGNGNGVTFGSANTARIGFAPGIGYRIASWDFTGRINVMSDFTYPGVRAAYVFGSK